MADRDALSSVGAARIRLGHPVQRGYREVLAMDHGFDRYLDTVPHLSGLWHTALQGYRLDHSRGLIDPVWQLL